MLERYTMSEDETELQYEIIISDPENLVEPAIWDHTWVYKPSAASGTTGVAIVLSPIPRHSPKRRRSSTTIEPKSREIPRTCPRLKTP